VGRNSVNGDWKLCTGPLHRDGLTLPLTRFYQHADGKPFSQCIDCRNFYLGRGPDSGLIPMEQAQPLLDRLFQLAGGKTIAAMALGLQRNYFSRGQASIRRKTFNDCRALLEKLDQDRHWNRGEAEIVDPEPLGSVLRAWIVKWLAERPILSQSDIDEDQTGSYHSERRKVVGMHFMGPLEWLAEKTEINIRRVSGICNGEFERVGLSQADALLTAIGEPYLLGNEIPVRANPTWSMESWLAYMASRGCV
jgi:hypothetical protein